MRKLLTVLSLTLILGASSAVPSVQADPSFPISLVNHSVVKLVIGVNATATEPAYEGHCTAFSINEKDGYYMTAAHCRGDRLSIGGMPAMVVLQDNKEDIMVVKAFYQAQALKLAKGAKQGDLVAGVGYGLSSPRPLVQVGYIIDFEFNPYTNQDMSRLIISTGLIPGMSGGPIINRKGEVVSVVNLTGYPDDWYQNIGAGAVMHKVKDYYLMYNR